MYQPSATAIAGLVLISRIGDVLASLMITSSNLSRGWIARGVGEDAYLSMVHAAARGSRQQVAELFVLAAGLCPVVVGVTIMRAALDVAPIAYWAGFGVALYGLVSALHPSTFIVRVFREAKAEVPAGARTAVPLTNAELKATHLDGDLA